MSRETIKPKIGGCESPDARRQLRFGKTVRDHQWEYSRIWNGNDKSVLPFHSGTRGITRSGWRCYHCGKFVWDEPDEIFALKFAYYMNMLPDFQELMQGGNTLIQRQFDRKHAHGVVISNERKHVKQQS